jgi:LysR family hca operon transcriptional activator
VELRHLRYFVAVAEEGSLTVAAEHRLHTAQPSLSRQIRDLEYEVGAPLLRRGARGVELTGAGRAFLDHARLALAQAEAAIAAARRADQPAKPSFALGFLTFLEMDWLPKAMNVLRDELPSIDVTISSDHSPNLAGALPRGKLDLAFMRPEPQMPDLEYKVVATQPLVVVLPRDHRLAAQAAIALRELAGETYLGIRTRHRRCGRSSRPISSVRGSIFDPRNGSTIWRWRCPWSHRPGAWPCCRPMPRASCRPP